MLTVKQIAQQALKEALDGWEYWREAELAARNSLHIPLDRIAELRKLISE